MGKNLQHQETGISIEGNHPGCMWSILHVLHQHRWHHVRKKMLPLKRHGGGSHATGKKINAKNDGETHELTDGDTNTLNEEKAAQPTPVAKSSMKSRIKSLIADEMSKRRGRHRRSSSYPTRVQLTRTDSIHHLESSNANPLTEDAPNEASPQIVALDKENSSSSSTLVPLQSQACEEPVTSNEKCEICAAMLSIRSIENNTFLQDKLNRAKQDLLAQKMTNESDVSFHESNQFLDILHMFNMNKELFLKVLLYTNPPLPHYSHGRRASNSKKGFNKSMSFPLPGKSGRRDFKPSKLEHGQATESCVKWGEKTQSAEFEFAEDTSESSMPLEVESKNDGVSEPDVGKNRKDNKVIIKRFKNLKQKIKHAIRESRKERHRITMDAVLHKIPYGRKVSKEVKEEIAEIWKEKSSPRSSFDGDDKGGQRHRRMSSCDESLDRYRQLYESTFNTEARHEMSEGLKLRTEGTPSPSWSFTKSLGRILSLPDLRSYYYLQNEDYPDISSSGTPISNEVYNDASIVSGSAEERKASGLPLGSENETLSDDTKEHGKLNFGTEDEVGSRALANEEVEDKVGFTADNLERLEATEVDVEQDNGVQASNLAEPSPISTLDSSQEDMSSPTKFFLSEVTDSTLAPTSPFSDEMEESLDSMANQQHEASIGGSLTVSETRVNLEKMEMSIDKLNTEFLRVLVNTKDVAEFNYVKYVLELSGFSRNELLGTWYSPDHPVDPSVFEEVEGCSENEEGGDCNHLLLFDLINEVLLEIYERSFMYCPLPLSSASHSRPVPMGYHVLEEVWANISCYLSCKPELDQLLDNAISRDLAKGDRWMNLQFEAECVGLELEDMIFDDLLEDMLYDDLLDELLSG